MKDSFFRKSAALLLASSMLPVFPVHAEQNAVTMTPTDLVPTRGVFGEIAPAVRQDPEPDNAEEVRVSVLLEDDCTIAAGFTDGMTDDAVTYRQALLAKQKEIADAISGEALDGDDLDVVWNLTLAANLISANVPVDALDEIRAVDGVMEVVIETIYYPAVYSENEGCDPAMATSASMTGSYAAWESGYTGAGQRVAVIDTGTDTDHISFDEGAFLHALSESETEWDLLDADEIASVWDQLNLSAKYTGTPESLYINAKLPFGYNYIDRNSNVTHDRDSQGSHGSHVAGIAAANRYVRDGDGYADASATVSMAGAAPDAQLLTMKVFGQKGGAYDSDYMAAIEDAVVLGCDAINLSLGTAYAGSSRSDVDAFQEILDNLSKTSAVVSVSGGNSFSWAYAASPLGSQWGYPYADSGNFATATAPGTFTNTLSAASAENDGAIDPYLRCGDDKIFYTETVLYGTRPMTSLSGDYEFVFLADAGNEDADFAAIADLADGKIAVIRRGGGTSFAQKANAAVRNGAKAVLIVNHEPGILNMDLSDYDYRNPVASVTIAGGDALLRNAEKVTHESGTVCYTGTLTVTDDTAAHFYGSDFFTMSDFSGWGVPGSLELKPELTAPGGKIYSVDGSDKSGTAYKVMSGTSMAAPQLAGMTAVLAQHIEENSLVSRTGLSARTLAQSLLMSTSRVLTDPDSDYGTPYSVMKQGAGLANIGAAVSADSVLLMDDGTNAGAADGKIKVELGDDPEKNGEYTYGFTLYNLTGEDVTYALTGEYFTQNFFADRCNDAGDIAVFMDETTYPLLMHTTYTADGREILSEPGIFARDFNGDGSIDTDDGQTLLEYAVGVRDTIHDSSHADLNDDGRVDSYDAYLFFTSYSAAAVTVPANESVHITVRSVLSRDYASFLLSHMTNGFYIEGFTSVRAMTTDDGEEGEVHSIPVFGYYGSWTDMPMFDIGSAVEYLSGDEIRTPYLYTARKSAAYYANALTVVYADEPGASYVWGGNPLVPDAAYFPERNALNPTKGDAFDKFRFAPIRTAAASRITVSSGGTILSERDTGTILPAYYHISRKTWLSTSQSVTLDLRKPLSKLSDGDAFEVSLTLAPEYYVSPNGEVRWDDLGPGASLTFPGVIDTIPPTASDPVLDTEEMTLTVSAQDENWVSAVVLYNSTGTEALTWAGSYADIEMGESAEYTLDLDGLSGREFLLTVYDYAMNGTSFFVNVLLGKPDPAESVTVTPETITLSAGSTASLTALVLPETADPGVTWTSSDESVAVVDRYGLVTAVRDGCAVITASAPDNSEIYDTCTVTVLTLDVTVRGMLQGNDTVPRFFDWDLPHGDIETIGAYDGQFTAVSASGIDGVTYLVNDSYVICAVDETGAELESYETNGYPVWDFTHSTVFTDENSRPLIHGIYRSYIVPAAPVDGYEVNTRKDTVNLSAVLKAGTGAAKLTGIASYGAYTHDSVSGEGVFLLDDTGAVWFVLITEDRKVTVIGSCPSNLADFGAQFDGYSPQLLFCSLVYGSDDNLWLSEYRDDTTYLYRLSYVPETERFDAVRIGTMGDAVWPAALLEVTSDASENTIASAEGTLQAIDSPAIRPENTASLPPHIRFSEDGSTLTVEITAKDLSGNELDSTNGIAGITWDPHTLQLESASVLGAYTAKKHTDGSLLFGYVSPEGIRAGIPVGVLTFKVLAPNPGEITVLRREVNDTVLNTAETVDLHTAHLRTERRDYKLASLTKNGWTGDVYCADCGILLYEGAVIPAVGGPAIGTESGIPVSGVTIPGTNSNFTGWTKIMREIYAARRLRDERMAAEKAASLPCSGCDCIGACTCEDCPEKSTNERQ